MDAHEVPGPALVTGGAGGLGREVARALLAAGRDVALLDRSPAPLEAAAAEVATAGRRVAIVVADVGHRPAVQAAVAKVVAALGPVRVGVNAAGIADSAPLLPPDDGLFDRTMAVNLRGAWVVSTACLPGMIAAGGGRIVNVASTAALRGFRYVAAYVASKHALLGLTRAMAADLAAKRVTVNAVCPGFMDTPMTDRALEAVMRATGRSREQALQSVLESGGQTRLIPPAEVAREIARLCSPEADATGQAVEIL